MQVQEHAAHRHVDISKQSLKAIERQRVAPAPPRTSYAVGTARTCQRAVAREFYGQRVWKMREASRLQIAQAEFLKGIMQMLPETLYPFIPHFL